jgi:tripartite-type tricarboxylate transporter receptor subunit TctC
MSRAGIHGAAAPVAAAVSAIGARAFAQAFPTKPLRIIVPFPAGGTTDVIARFVAQRMSETMGQPVLVENRGGAGGTLAMPILQQAEPDGYTIAQLPQPVFRAPFTQKVLWDPIRDTTPIIQISGVSFGVLVPSASGL